MGKDLKTAVSSLEEAFSAVADAMKTEHPDVWDKAKEVFGHEDIKIAKWLASSSPALGNKSPCDVLSESDNGEEQVMDIIGRIEHGLF